MMMPFPQISDAH